MKTTFKHFSIFIFACAVGFVSSAAAQRLEMMQAAHPPMGWNSWDSFGTTVTEADVRANALWMHDHLQSHGWNYVVVDMEWFTQNPTAEGNGKNQRRVIDAFGRFVPAVNRFPSSAKGKGFAPLAEYVHSLGLQFGIHILQGVPREAMKANTPVEGSSWHATDAGDANNTCAWNPDYVDAKENAAGQAYYDSIARLYASWGVDFIKVDCIAAPKFKGSELKMLRQALDKTGHNIALSTSPGEPSIEHTPELQQDANQWRISNDVWDVWHNNGAYPQGVGDQFARTAYWNRTRLAGRWPDADMLPLGELKPAPGWGKPRTSRLSRDEQQTMMTLWSMFRSPLMVGGNLPLTSAETLEILTNDEVLAVDQNSTENTPSLVRPDAIVWKALPGGAAPNGDVYVAIFNLLSTERQVGLSWDDLGATAGRYKARNLWSHAELGELKEPSFHLRGHSSVLLRLSPLP